MPELKYIPTLISKYNTNNISIRNSIFEIARLEIIDDIVSQNFFFEIGFPKISTYR